MKQQRSWENITHAKRREIYNTLRWCLPGQRWLYENRNLYKDNEIKKLTISQTMSGLNKSFRYMILNDAISGRPFSIAASQQRYERRVRLIRIRASRIAIETGVRFEKVYSMLVERMNRLI